TETSLKPSIDWPMRTSFPSTIAAPEDSESMTPLSVCVWSNRGSTGAGVTGLAGDGGGGGVAAFTHSCEGQNASFTDACGRCIDSDNADSLRPTGFPAGAVEDGFCTGAGDSLLVGGAFVMSRSLAWSEASALAGVNTHRSSNSATSPSANNPK